ncbi:hypothetical protein FA95DRAFT_890380 [Auriscalpium vulgare]|uniref:Uncharacterized protein n=1 Tax=Auriscalpium vulgare TaxID=40419 RepID=A0ACB8RZN8_9AGAM|nr:hypothetical protein FA95DRAFT_890380 [Auriscalpium vulgare]
MSALFAPGCGASRRSDTRHESNMNGLGRQRSLTLGRPPASLSCRCSSSICPHESHKFPVDGGDDYLPTLRVRRSGRHQSQGERYRTPHPARPQMHLQARAHAAKSHPSIQVSTGVSAGHVLDK